MTQDYGYVLEVDLSTEKIDRYHLDSGIIRDFLGGVGVVARIYWDKVPPDIKVFDEENVLIFATGPLTASGAPGTGRAIVVGNSPQSHPERYTVSSFGGEWGAELRLAGYDILVIRCKAKKPVYLWIKDEEVEIRDASHL